MDQNPLQHSLKHIKALLFLILLLFPALLMTLASCRPAVPKGDATLASITIEKPTTTKTPTQTKTPTNTPSPTATEQASHTPSSTATQQPTHTPSPKLTPTKTSVYLYNPEAEPEAYQLNPWEQVEALRVLTDSQTVNITDFYSHFRPFYQVSLLEEIWLHFPSIRTEPDLISQMADLKGSEETYFEPYGYIHDYSVEPFRLMLETALNAGNTSLDQLSKWVEKHDSGIASYNFLSERLFDQPGSAMLVQITDNVGWGFFIIRTHPDGSYTVLALYPEWEQYWWSREYFEITDLNNNGRDEIAITREDWGTGLSNFCRGHFKLYEWDGSSFRNLMPESTAVYTDFGNCLRVSFKPDLLGWQQIQMGIEERTLCPEVPYQEITTYHWKGTHFAKQSSQVVKPPQGSPPGACTIDWALTAGPENDAAFRLLSEAISNWPAEAEEEWGPAARDYFSLRLAAWNIQRGHLVEGLAIVEKVRDNPYAPGYPFSSQIASAFLDVYARHGLYLAAQEVVTLIDSEVERITGTNNIWGRDTSGLLREWGYADGVWRNNYSYQNPSGFAGIWTIETAIKDKNPASLDEIITFLRKNRFHVLWSLQANLDGKGEEDWLVEIEDRQSIYARNYTFAFLRQGEENRLLRIPYLWSRDISNPPLWWGSFQPDPAGPVLNVLQIGSDLYIFRFLAIDKEIEVEFELDSRQIFPNSYDPKPAVKGWKFEGEELKVRYDSTEVTYYWDENVQRLVPTGIAPELQEQNIAAAERALYRDNDPAYALEIINQLLNARIYEEYNWVHGSQLTDPPYLRPYLMYLRGLAYEREGESDQAVRAYWQLWHEYPDHPFSLAAQSKLQLK